MSSPKDGGAAQRRSRLEAVAGAASANAETGSVRRPDALKRFGRYVALAAFAGAILALVVQVGLQVAMAQLGPPPLQRVAHLVPGFAQHRAAQKSDLAPIVLAPDQVDPRYLAMLFAFEDRRFYSHFGVDPVGIARAARDLILKQRIVSGGSTLTMQVARLLDNQYKRTPSVKLRQIVRAFQLERQLSKQADTRALSRPRPLRRPRQRRARCLSQVLRQGAAQTLRRRGRTTGGAAAGAGSTAARSRRRRRAACAQLCPQDRHCRRRADAGGSPTRPT